MVGTSEAGAVASLAPAVVQRADLQRLLDALTGSGYRILGPTVRDGAVVYDEVRDVTDLPIGWTDVQDGGTYRLVQNGDASVFGFTIGPQSWKRFLHPPIATLWRASRSNGDFEIVPAQEERTRWAFLGVRACELHAIAIQDRIFLHGPHPDPIYANRRSDVFVLAVNCGHSGGTCFCVSMNTGPKVGHGFDLALTEILKGTKHYFVVEIGSERGAEILEDVPCRPATEVELHEAAKVVERTASQMGRRLETDGLKEALAGSPDHPRWDQVAERCLTCGNCTLVCPTCFCATVEDVTDLTGDQAERRRVWDSCFTLGFSYIHGGTVRRSAKSRYRQWLTHKLSTWYDQFGTSGCVGCGRCITWCPVGIDITEEARAIRGSTVTLPAHEEMADEQV
jgi:sulfhydrogenase subunit beta (sulfur reductase)